jgi:EAL domain-containing protein (putative c-di-GMP-specific phosphodiesterase class I)
LLHLLGTQAVAFRVLIVDGEAIQRLIIARCVEMLGWTADTAGTVDEARGKLAVRAYGVVVIDLGLGREDGLRMLHHVPRGREVPSVIFVAAADDRIRAAAFSLANDLGLAVAGMLTRPIDPYSLHALLLTWPLNPRRAGRRTTGKSSGPGAEDLEHALRDGQIHTEYQPKTDLSTGQIVGMEALARWHSPTHGMIPPEQFVPLAERSGLIDRLTFQVLEDAIAACRRWREVRPDYSVAVNISPRVLADPTLVPHIDEILSRHRMPPDALIAEVTESTMICNLPIATETLTRLSHLGVRVSMDDFGTGYSSLLTLLRMPFTELKIDRSFISVCRTDSEAWTIVRAAVSLARELGMRVVAEGIETEDLSDRLRDVGCDIGQGWFFGRPMRVEAILAWLNAAADRAKQNAAEMLVT